MKENEFGSLIKQRLDEGARQIDGIMLQRLEAARTEALSHVRSAERELQMASHASGSRGGQILRMSGNPDGARQHRLRVLFIGLALIALTAGSIYWQQANTDDDEDAIGLLDAKMLSSDLPLNTFTHPDFKAWVNGTH